MSKVLIWSQSPDVPANVLAPMHDNSSRYMGQIVHDYKRVIKGKGAWLGQGNG